MSISSEKIRISGDVEIRFGWDAYPRQYSRGLIGALLDKNKDTTAVDCDGSAIFCDKYGHPISEDIQGCCVNYRNMRMFNSAAIHNGDNTTGDLYDDEIISLNLREIPANVESIVFTLDVFKEKKWMTGKISNTFLRITVKDSDDELCRCDFCNLGINTKLIVAGKLVRNDDNWFFNSNGGGVQVKSLEEFIVRLRSDNSN